MELQAIIGVRKGKIGVRNVRYIGDYLVRKRVKLKGCTGRLKNIPEPVPDAKDIFYAWRKNLYIHATNITNPQEFYCYLSQRGFVLRDSKLTRKAE